MFPFWRVAQLFLHAAELRTEPANVRAPNLRRLETLAIKFQDSIFTQFFEASIGSALLQWSSRSLSVLAHVISIFAER